MGLLTTLLARNAWVLAALLAFAGWAHMALSKHDAKVTRTAVEKIERKTDVLVTKARVAQRRVDPSASGGVLARRYCEDC